VIWILGALITHAFLLLPVGVALIGPMFLLLGFIKVSAALSPLAQACLLALILPFLYYLFGICLLLVSIACYRLFNLSGPREETIKKEDWLKLVPFAIYHGLLNLCQIFFLWLIRSSELLRLFYIGMGAKIGAGTIVNTDAISDCFLIEIGENCVIGAYVAVSGHMFANGILRRGRVKIGNNVTVGTNTTILPNCTIEDGVLIGPNSLVPSGMTLKQGLVYVGVPVRLASIIGASKPA